MTPVAQSQLPQLTLTDFEEKYAKHHLLHGTVAEWARQKPDGVALIDADRKQKTTWAAFDRMTTALAIRLLECGFTKGETFASFLPLTSEHIFLEYACFKIGVIFVPLDLRLPPAELLRCMQAVKARGFAFVKAMGVADPCPVCREIRACLPMRLMLQFSADEKHVEGATLASNFVAEALRLTELASGDRGERMRQSYKAATAAITENDPALVIFTTGSTGSPKPALLSHCNISCQAMCISRMLLHGSDKDLITLVNLPASHVGCQTELLMGTLFDGGTAVLVKLFEPLRSMRAIVENKVTVIGQIPAMYQFEWRLKDYDSIDLSSLEFAAYGGQPVIPNFLKKMATMAPYVGTGLGLTETAGFCTYVRKPAAQAEECATGLGVDMPVYPMTIRHAMRADGTAGEEVPEGEIGHICFKGPQTFLGYLNDPEATAATISKDGYLYSGDMGYRKDGELQLSGRSKLILKPGGYQVFPGDVENHFAALDAVAQCAAVGVPHPVLSEAIILFVEKLPETELTVAELQRHGRGLASYMRPRHYVVLEAGYLPLTRVAKSDYMRLRKMAQREVDELIAKGQWSSAEL